MPALQELRQAVDQLSQDEVTELQVQALERAKVDLIDAIKSDPNLNPDIQSNR